MASGGVVEDLALTGVSVVGRTNVGALAGVSSGTIRRVYAGGSITTTQHNTGGLVGQNWGTIEQSVSGVSVGGNFTFNRGGLVGLNLGGATVRDSLATGRVSAHRQSTGVGGLVGDNRGGISNSYATGRVVNNRGESAFGGLVGVSGGWVTASYWDTETSGRSTSVKGTGKTTAELESPIGPGTETTDIYHGWDPEHSGTSAPTSSTRRCWGCR